jgi:hypothetical protein
MFDCGGRSGAGAGFLRVLRFPLPVFIPPIAPHSSRIFRGWYNRPVSGRRTNWTQSHPIPRKNTTDLAQGSRLRAGQLSNRRFDSRQERQANLSGAHPDYRMCAGGSFPGSKLIVYNEHSPPSKKIRTPFQFVAQC